MGLPKNVRAYLAERLIESLEFDEDKPLSTEWSKEIDRRCQQIDYETPGILRDEKDVIANVQKKLNEAH